MIGYEVGDCSINPVLGGSLIFVISFGLWVFKEIKIKTTGDNKFVSIFFASLASIPRGI